MGSGSDIGDGDRRERIFNAPWPSLLIAAAIPVLFYMQTRQANEIELVYQFGFMPADLGRGRIGGLVTHMLLHGNWAHAGMNAVGALAFGAPVARLLDRPVMGAAGFFAFYVLCGAAAALGYGLIHPDSVSPLIGASGGVFGLIGAATRLMGTHGRLASPWARRVLMAAAAWIGLNLFIGLTGFAPGAAGVAVAWEAHVVGLLVGLLLIGPWARIFARPPAAI